MHHYLRPPPFFCLPEPAPPRSPAARAASHLSPPPLKNNKTRSSTTTKKGKRAVAKGGHRYRQGQGGPAAAPPGPAPHLSGAASSGVVIGGRGVGASGGLRPPLRPPPFSLFLLGIRETPEPGESPRATRQRVPAFVGRTLARLFFSFGTGVFGVAVAFPSLLPPLRRGFQPCPVLGVGRGRAATPPLPWGLLRPRGS